MDILVKSLEFISEYAILFIIVSIPTYGLIRKVNVYESFTNGAKEGFNVAIKIIPYLVAMLVAIGIFRASGAMDLLLRAMSPITNFFNIPGELIPMAIMRPLSGGGATGIATSIMESQGVDSFAGTAASVMMGSTETTFYVLAVYFGSIGIKRERHALLTGLTADFFGLVAAIVITKIMFF